MTGQDRLHDVQALAIAWCNGSAQQRHYGRRLLRVCGEPARCSAGLAPDCEQVAADVEATGWARKRINGHLMYAVCPRCVPLLTSWTEFGQRVKNKQW